MKNTERITQLAELFWFAVRLEVARIGNRRRGIGTDEIRPEALRRFNSHLDAIL